ncbi:Glycogen synthase kinase-3 beta [Trichinella britovi]|uniref:Glycogen synthase kinase-3 beta n=1 Tax=Trichinella britovi TaxID=45882 RepID=A0A0V1DI40_TRIBR|nr:Glycogen synthase kinase-3 beta [Trichinella britovi]
MPYACKRSEKMYCKEILNGEKQVYHELLIFVQTYDKQINLTALYIIIMFPHSGVTFRVMAPPENNQGEDLPFLATFTNIEKLGKGSFGTVCSALIVETSETVAIKRVKQDASYKNRELDIIKRLKHQNIVTLKYFFFETTSAGILYLNLVMECFSDDLYKLIKRHEKTRQPIHMSYLFTYQILRALAYVHSFNIAHRDLKPENALVNGNTAVLKICDWGSAKVLEPNERSISYICSRHYRAPELCLGATSYTPSVDLWSVGCILCELLLGHPIFLGRSSRDQMIKVFQILDYPTSNDIMNMKVFVNLNDYRVRRLTTLRQVLPPNTPDNIINLISRLLKYSPNDRIKPLAACAHDVFDELRQPNFKLPSNYPLPPLFNFTEYDVMYFIKNLACSLSSMTLSFQSTRKMAHEPQVANG